MKPSNGRRRVVIEEVSPQVDGGRHAVRRIAGDEVAVTAAIYADGRDEVAARLLYRHSSDKQWWFAPMHALGNDLWRGTFLVDKLGAWSFCLLGWVDHFRTWSGDLKKRIAAQADAAQADSLSIDAIPGAALNPATGLSVDSKKGTPKMWALIPPRGRFRSRFSPAPCSYKKLPGARAASMPENFGSGRRIWKSWRSKSARPTTTRAMSR